MALNVTTAAIASGANTAIAQPSLAQWDQGQILKIEGVELPESYQVEFSGGGTVRTVPMIGTAEGVQIPNKLLQSSHPITAHVVLHESATDRETEYWITIYVKPRQAPETVEIDPADISIIDQTIAAAQQAVATSTAQAEAAAGSAEEAAAAAETAEASATAADGSASSAASSERSAGASAVEADQAKTAAETAQAAAEAAQAAAEQAVTDAQAAGSQAVEAIDEAKTVGIQAIDAEAATQINQVGRAGATQIRQINELASNQMRSIETKTTQSIGAIEDARDAAIEDVQTEGQTQTAAAQAQAQAAAGSATAAANSANAAAGSASAAATARTGAETAAASVSASAAQIAQNASDITDLNRQISDLTSTVDDLVLEKTITRDSVGRETVDYPIRLGDLIQLTNTAPSNGNDVAFRAQGSSENLQMVYVPANSTITVVSTVNADCLSPYFQAASSIIAKTLNKRVPVLEDEMQESVKSLDNVQERITAIDLHPYIPFEIGYISSDENGFVYSDMDTRVRTKRGFTIELKTGDKVGLNDYTGVRYILFRYDYTTETYKSSGWLTTSWIVENSTEGLYGIMLAYNPDKAVTDITELTKLFYINKQVNVGTPLRVMSFNLGHFAYGQVGIGTTYKWGIADSIYADRLKNWESFFIKYNADLLCTQEYSRCLDRVHDGETDASGTKITDTIIFDKLYSNKMVCQTSGNVFVDNRSFTNCTLLDSASVQIGSNGLYCTYSHISIDNKTIALVNLHLSTTAEKRLSEFRAIKTLLQNEKYAIICGDFNTQDQEELSIFSQGNYKVINGGTDARRYSTNSTIAYYCGQDETAKISWYDFDKRVYQRETREKAIDNIIVTQNIDVLDFIVCGDDFENLTSDHCAILAELSIR